METGSLRDQFLFIDRRCSLVHADLSEYNLLWHEGQVIFIDVSQSVDLAHPFAHEFLLRDCKNIVHFFTKHHTLDIQVNYSLKVDEVFVKMSTRHICVREVLMLANQSVLCGHQLVLSSTDHQNQTH